MKTEQFCQEILGVKVGKIKSLVNLIIGLSENNENQSVVGISENKHYLYQYSSITDAINGFFVLNPKWTEEDKSKAEAKIERQKMGLIIKMLYPNSSGYILLNTDITSVFRPHSKTLEEREIVFQSNNKIVGNKPVGIGHHISCIGYSGGDEVSDRTDWNVPLSMKRVGLNENKNEFTAKQVRGLIGNFGNEQLVVNCLDSNYSSPEYIAGTYETGNLVNIIRLASNRNTWTSVTEKEGERTKLGKQKKQGAKLIYGTAYKLSESESWGVEADNEARFDYTLSKGRELVVKVKQWSNRKIRTKRGYNMKDKPFNLIKIELFDKETNKLVHRRPLWLGVWKGCFVLKNKLYLEKKDETRKFVVKKVY